MTPSLFAAIDISSVTSAITSLEANLATIIGSALGVAVVFMGYRLVRRAIDNLFGHEDADDELDQYSDAELADAAREDREARGIDEYGDRVD